MNTISRRRRRPGQARMENYDDERRRSISALPASSRILLLLLLLVPSCLRGCALPSRPRPPHPEIFASNNSAAAAAAASSSSSSSSSGAPSHFSYSRAQCGSWLERTLARLSSLPARVRSLLEAEYRQCQVDYRDKANNDQQGDLFDFSMFERVGSPDSGR